MLASILLLAACNETRSTQKSELAATASSDSTLHNQINTSAAVTTSSLDNIEFDQFEDLFLTSEPTQSIWPRVRAGFQLPSDIQHKALEAEIKWFAKHPEYIQRVLQRADPFLYYIMEEAEKRNLPTELVLLPIVESAYQPFAYSHGRAAGIWQFIPSTGLLYGLKQNWWYDGRRDIYASTQAALNYLE
ncbi:MAG: transglycosylase SLT domain-containing protein, partial [Gammaproteobacteria bacterium]|nr:transglycosylase SLT domain-containing protein [Gammaproteobacteria bacterium]